MNTEQTELLIDELLTFMNDEVEAGGHSIKVLGFNFGSGKEDMEAFCAGREWTEEQVHRALNICSSRQLITCDVCGAGDFNRQILTEKGQGRAISKKLGRPRTATPDPTMSIQTLNITGPAQVGNGNIQNFGSFFNEIIQQIEKADAPPADKADVKNLLSRFLEHPLTTAIAGGATGGLVSLLRGGA